MKKQMGLAAFTRRANVPALTAKAADTATEDELERDRRRAKKDVVALTVRLQRAEWERLHQLAASEGLSIQALAVRGLNRVFTEKGLPRLAEGG